MTIAVRSPDRNGNPKVGEIVESNGVLFSVKASNKLYIVLIAFIKNKVAYIDSCKQFKEGDSIVISEWYPEPTKDGYVYPSYIGDVTFISYHEIIS